MALVSPGIQVNIIDESQYLPAASNSVPLILVATAQNKANAAGTGVATATTAANANKLQLMTSQRDLTTLFGNPFFYKTSNGTPIHGYELNEYGLQAAYSVLGVTNRAYVLRADIDLAELVGTLSRPVGAPADGTYWLDTTSSTWGIYEFNATTGKFANKTPIVITESSQIINNYPKESVGSVGSYAVIPSNVTEGKLSRGTYFYKSLSNIWVVLGSSEWKAEIPTAALQLNNISSGQFTISVDGTRSHVITVSPGDTVTDITNAINATGDGYIRAVNRTTHINLMLTQPGEGHYLTFTDGVGTPLANLGGITAGKKYYAAEVKTGTSAQMPNWTASQTSPHPTGSVWLKTSVAGQGLNVVLSKYSQTTASYNGVPVTIFSSLLHADAELDSTGGKAVDKDTVVGVATDSLVSGNAALSWYYKKNSGPTIAYGTNTSVNFSSTKQIFVRVGVPGSATPTLSYTVECSGNNEDFVTAWSSKNIPNTTATIGASGEIVLSHTLGGLILLSDTVAGMSNGALDELGFANGVNGIYGGVLAYTATIDDTKYTTNSGEMATFTVINNANGYYEVSMTSGGGAFAEGDTIVISGEHLGGVDGVNDLTLTVQTVGTNGVISSYLITSGVANVQYSIGLTNWDELTYVSNEGAPSALPANGTDWFYSTATQVDIMVNEGGSWKGYGMVGYDDEGHPASLVSNTTDALGVIVSATAPSQQTTGDDLVPGDLWLNTSDLENYPALSRWEIVDDTAQWVAIDNTDQTSSKGIVFADARWASAGDIDPVNDPIPTISSLLVSDYLDLDAPDAALYPQGMLLFNTRRSGYNVKRFTTNYFTQARFPGEALPAKSYTWVTSSGLKSDGSAYMGRKAQRNMVVQAMKAAIGTNMSIREEDTFFNLIAAPGYPELQPDMVGLNNERNNTAYIIGDTPLRLNDQATDLTNWATNKAGATSSGEDGWVTRDTYLGVFYPSGITTDVTGAAAVVPASHMMLRTMIRNDTVAYPWLAPAGTRRGTIDNATNIGYIDAATGEFQTVKNRMGIRDVLYTNQINPLAYFTGVGLLNYGNKNSFDSQSALDRINVARLVAYIRERLQVAARPFVFEPNDALTRGQLTSVVQSLFVDLVAKRGLYDYLVVCDESNNTPARIDRNELWIDIAIEPVKAAEFIYIPVRVMNTGEIASLK